MVMTAAYSRKLGAYNRYGKILVLRGGKMNRIFRHIVLSVVLGWTGNETIDVGTNSIPWADEYICEPKECESMLDVTVELVESLDWSEWIETLSESEFR